MLRRGMSFGRCWIHIRTEDEYKRVWRGFVMREKILAALEQNGRIELKELAIMLDIKEAELANEIAQMEKEHIICGYNTIINWDKTNEEKVTALIEVKVTPQRGHGFDNIAERIYNYSEVSSLYLMSGGFDFTVIIEGKSMKSVALFVSSKLATIEGVISTSTHFVLKKYKVYGSPLEADNKDERMLVTP
jgi:DNA-binding Lrp family transcriptional regulator